LLISVLGEKMKKSEKLFRKNPGGAGSAGRQKAGESAYTAPSGIFVCL
jgi:hypothetical protein